MVEGLILNTNSTKMTNIVWRFCEKQKPNKYKIAYLGDLKYYCIFAIMFITKNFVTKKYVM